MDKPNRRWPTIRLVEYKLGVEFACPVHFADGRFLTLAGSYFVNPGWWFIALTRPVGNDNRRG
jgi:hypothetical protein